MPTMLAALILLLLAGVAVAEPQGAIAMHGRPLRPGVAAPWPYARADAPKGGTLSLGEKESFDSLNPFIFKGRAAEGLRGNVYESLLARAGDEPFSLYGLIAETVDVPDDRRQATFKLRAEARFSDGQPITPADVIFTMGLLRDKGWPFYRSHFGKVAAAEEIAPGTVRFTFKSDADRELPLILGLMAILPRHKTDPDAFERTTLEPPVGSGPYIVAKVDAGRRITYQRNPNWWARDLAINRGRYNFDEITIDYYSDETALFEAFKAGRVDLRVETEPNRWTQGYRFPAALDGAVKLAELDTRLPAGMAALVFNTRRPLFADVRVRRALIELFDFEWINRSLHSGLYRRTESYFARSGLASTGVPADDRERALLGATVERIRPDILAGRFALPVSDGSGASRDHLRRALALLAEAGYVLRGTELVSQASGKPMAFEFLAKSKAEERLMLAYGRALSQIGIKVTIRMADSAQYWLRVKTFDFDMVQWHWPASLSPGNELLNRFASRAATAEGSQNLPGIADPAADAMIAAILAAKPREDFTAAVHALDRVLLAGDYVIPLYHLPKVWLAHWNYLERPAAGPLDGLDLSTWWTTRDRK